MVVAGGFLGGGGCFVAFFFCFVLFCFVAFCFCFLFSLQCDGHWLQFLMCACFHIVCLFTHGVTARV